MAEWTPVNSVSPSMSPLTSDPEPDPDKTGTWTVIDQKISGTTKETLSLWRRKNMIGEIETLSVYRSENSACPNQFTQAMSVIENEDEMNMTLSSGSNSVTVTRRTGKDKDKTLSSESCAGARPRWKKMEILEEIFEEYFKKFWWFVNVDIFAYERKSSDAVILIKDYPEALKGIKRIFSYNGKQVGVTRTVFVSEIPTTVEDDEFSSFFSQYGIILEHGIVRYGKAHESLGFGFIIFSSKKESISLVKKCKQDPLELGGGKIIVKKIKIKKVPDFSRMGNIELSDDVDVVNEELDA